MLHQTAKITILGSGTMMPTKERNPSGFLFELGKTKILLDCGHGVIRRMVDYGIDPQTIDAVFISHFHTDHFGDAFNLVHARWVDDIYHKRKQRKLTFLGPQELEKKYKLWRKIYWLEPEESYPLKFKEGPQKLKIDDLTIETFEVQHVPWFQSVGIKIEWSGKKIVYPGDIGSSHDFNDLIWQTQNANLLIIEAGYEKPTPNHFTLKQVEETTKKANIQKILIVHIRPDLAERLQDLVSKEPNFQLAKDGQVIEI